MGGARDAIAAGNYAEGLARLDLLCAAGEQVCIDGGSWILARELVWEEDPPYAAWASQRPPDPLRGGHSRLTTLECI